MAGDKPETFDCRAGAYGAHRGRHGRRQGAAASVCDGVCVASALVLALLMANFYFAAKANAFFRGRPIELTTLKRVFDTHLKCNSMT